MELTGAIENNEEAGSIVFPGASQPGLMTRSFAGQKFFSFDLDISIQNSSGVSSVGISGENGLVNLFSFNSGRVFDGLNRFVSTYSASEQMEVSGNFRSGVFGYYINQAPVCLNSNLCSSAFSFDSFVFSATGTNINCLLDVFGEMTPNYNLVFPNSSQLTGAPITGYIRNNSSLAFQSFKIFSGSGYFPDYNYQLTSNLSGLKIKPNNSGALVFVFSGENDFLLDEYKQAYPLFGDVYFWTNFGNFSIPVSIPLKSSPAYYLNFEQIENTSFGQTGTFWSFNLERQACSGTRFEFVFDDVRWLDPYYSFSNSFQIRTGYNNTGFASSLVSYNSATTRYIGTGFISGAGCSGSDTFNTRFEVLHSHPSGIYNNLFKYSISGIEEKFLFTGILKENNY
jgi:hypothetical protein